MIDTNKIHILNPKQAVFLITDASPYGVGVQLCNKTDESKLVMVACASATLTISEQNYSHSEKETLALLYGVRNFHKYLYGRHFTVLTDSIPVTLFFGAEKAIPSSVRLRLVRWSLFLSGYTNSIVYNKEVQVADRLSRLPSEITGDEEISKLYVLNVRADASQLETIQNEIQKDPVLRQVFCWTVNGWPSYVPKVYQNITYKSYYRIRSEITVFNKCLFKGGQVTLPTNMRTAILQSLYQQHLDINRIKETLKSY